MGQYYDSDGRIVEVDDAYAQGRGMRAVTDEERFGAVEDRAQDIRDDSRGLLGTINAAATSALSGATLGLSDVALGGLMTEGERDALRGDRRANEGVSTAANIAGGLAATFAAPGSLLARSPAGAVSQFAARGVAKGGAARAVAYSGLEGAAQTAGSYLSDVALGDRELTAEGMAGALGRGFAFGGVAGGAVHGITRGTIAARRMFARTGAAKQVQAVETEWTNKSAEVFDAHDELLATAKRRIDESRLAHADAAANRARIDADITARRAELAEQPAPVREPVAEPFAEAPPPAAAAAEPPPTPAATPAPTSAPQPGPVPLTLEAQLAEMQSRVNAGATLQDLNAQRVTAPLLPPAKVEQIAEAVAELEAARKKLPDWVTSRTGRTQHHGINYEGPTNAMSGFGRVRQTFANDVPVEQSSGMVRIIGKGENPLDALTPNSRLMGADVMPDRELGRALDEEYHEALDMARTAATQEERQFALEQAAKIDDEITTAARGQRPELDAVIDRIETLRKQHGRSSLTSAEKRMERLQDRYEQAGEKHMLPKPERQPAIPRSKVKPDVEPVKQPSFVDETAQAADAISEYEKAAAKLTDTLDDAPQAAKDARDALRKAEAESERRVFDRTARAVDDHAGGVKPRGKRAKDEKLAELTAERRQAEIAMKRAKQSEAEAMRDAEKAQQGIRQRPAKPGAVEVVPSEPSNRLGTLANIGAVLEAADTIGIPGLPRPSDLPVVGPLLGLYLKYRAVKAIAGRMTGRVPAAGDARAAALAAKTKDRALAAVDKMLGMVERGAPTARKLAVSGGGRLADALSKPYADDGESPKDASLPELAAVRARELSEAVANPQMIANRVRGELHDVADPDLIAAAEAFEARKIAYLHEHAPKEPPSGPLVKRKWTPTLGESMKFARRAEVADDPIVALEAVENRSITKEQADTLRALYPRLFASCQERLVERAAEITETVPRDQRFRMSLLFDVPLDRLMEGDNLALLQSVSVTQASATPSPAAPTPAQPPMPSIAGPVDLTALYTTPSDRRAARR